jgi:muramoyltetrapeptide carboxypeptidase
LKLPAFLQKGDLILLVASARAKSESEISGAIALLISWGLKVKAGENIFKKHNQFAGTDTERAADLQWAISHQEAKAVLFTGGGYGTIRIMDDLDFSPLKNYPKWFIGYSDVTVIHNKLHLLGITSIHGTMAFQFEKHEGATESVKKILFGEQIVYPLAPHSLNRLGSAEAEITGGNLSILYALSGTPEDVNPDGKILFIEDLDEYLYHIDRMMLQLKRSGKLKNLKGLIVGGMSDMKDNLVPFGKAAEEIILEAVKEYEFPVCFGFPAGHITENFAMCFGRKATLNVSKTEVNLMYL